MRARFPSFVRRRLGWLTLPWYDDEGVTRLGWRGRNYLLTHPDDIRHVLLGDCPKDSRVVGRGGQQREGSGIVTSAGERHKELRTRFLPAFGALGRDCLSPATDAQSQRLLESWRGLDVVDLSREMPHYAMTVILHALLGPDAVFNTPLRRALKVRQLYTERLWYAKLPFREHLPLAWGYRAAEATVTQALETHPPGSDLLSRLRELAHSQQEACDEARSFLGSGHDAMGEMLTWCLFLLARHPEAQARARDCAAYLDAAIYESLRLYPPTWLFGRTAPEPLCLPSGATVPAGANLVICQFLMHRHARYFSEPEAFRPERFLEGDWRARWRFVYFPFGLGGRVCPGEKLARGGCAQTVEAVLRDFDLEGCARTPVRLKLGMALRPAGPLLVRLRPRRTAPCLR